MFQLRLNEMKWNGMIYSVCSFRSIELYVADWFMTLPHSYWLHSFWFFIFCFVVIFIHETVFYDNLWIHIDIIVHIWIEAVRISYLYCIMYSFLALSCATIRFSLLSINKMRLSFNSMEIKISFLLALVFFTTVSYLT